MADTTRILLTRQNEAVHFVATNADLAHCDLDGSPEVGGQHAGLRPMEMVLAASAGCSAIDIDSILRKQKFEIADFHITVEGQKEKVESHSEWRHVHLTYHLWGEAIPAAAAQRAIVLSLGKYCSVSKLLAKTAHITADLILNEQAIGRVFPQTEA